MSPLFAILHRENKWKVHSAHSQSTFKLSASSSMRRIFSVSVTVGLVCGWILYLAGTAYYQGQECFIPQLAAGPGYLLGASLNTNGPARTGHSSGPQDSGVSVTLQFTQQAAFTSMKSAIQLALATTGSQLPQASLDQIINNQWMCYSTGQTQADFEKCFQAALAAVTKPANQQQQQQPNNNNNNPKQPAGTGGRKLLTSSARTLLSESSDCGWRLSLQWWTVALEGLIAAVTLVLIIMEHRPLFTRVKLLTACYLCINSTLLCGVASFYVPLSDTLWSRSASEDLFSATAITVAGLICTLVFNFLWLANWTLIEDNGVVVPDFRKGLGSASFNSDKDVLPEFKKVDVI